MPRFVLLRHECPPTFGKPSHWDLMLEDDGVLLTWSVTTLPVAGGVPVTAERLGDHRQAYLDYEGPLSGARGEVLRVDAGEFDWLERGPACVRVQINGTNLRGTLQIEHTDGPECQVMLTS
jgi:hypothetical protein